MHTPRLEPLEARIAPANLASAFGLGGSQNDTVYDIAVDASGNTYISGNFNGTVDFDPGPGVVSKTTPGGRETGYVAKYTSAGQLAWVDLVSPSNEGVSDIHLAASPLGDVFISGEFGSGGTVLKIIPSDDDPAAVQQIGAASDLFVAKLSPNGHVAWATAYGTGNPVNVKEEDIAIDGNGGVYVVGTFSAVDAGSTISFTAGSVLQARAGDQNLFALKLDGLADAHPVVWASATSSTGAASKFDNLHIAADSSGNVAIAGSFVGDATFDVSPTPVTLSDPGDGMFVSRLDSSGGWSFAGQLGLNGTNNHVSGVALDFLSNLYVSGTYGAQTDFDITTGTSNLTPSQSNDGFLAKYSTSGSLLFAKDVASAKSDTIGTALGMSSAGQANAAFYSDHPFVLTYDSLGNIQSSVNLNQAPGTGIDAVALDQFGGLYVAGSFSKTTGDLDPGVGKTVLTGKGKGDVFVAHYFPGSKVGQDLINSFVSQSLIIGGQGEELGKQVLTDAAGNIYVAGLFSGTVDFDPGAGVTNLTSRAGATHNIFIAKYTSAGALVWARSVDMGYISSEGVTPNVAFALDNSGNVYLTGEYFGSATFGAFSITNSNPPNSSGLSDVFVTKLDSTGTYQWAESFGSQGVNDSVNAIAVRGTTGQVVLSGLFGGPVDFDPGAGVQTLTPTNGTGTFDSFILSLDTAGAYQWVHQLGGPNFAFASANSLALTAAGDVVVAGAFSGTVLFTPGQAASSLTADQGDIFVARFKGTDGSTLWNEKIGSTGVDNATAVAIASFDTIYVGGSIGGGVDFDPGTGLTAVVPAGGTDAFILRLDSTGASFGAIGFGSVGEDTVSQLQVDAGGNVLAFGKTGGKTDFDPGLGVSASDAAPTFLSRFTNNLNFLSARAVPAGFGTVDNQGNVFVTGSFTGNADLDPSATKLAVTSKGGNDLFMVKLTPDGAFDAAHPVSFHDADGDLVTVRLTGPGSGQAVLSDGNHDLSNLDTLSLRGTSLASALSVTLTQFGTGDGRSVVKNIVTTQTQEDLGSLTVGKTIVLGRGTAGGLLDISGKMETITLGDIDTTTLIRLGKDLPYNVVGDTTTPDTYNNHPDLTIGNVLGVGVEINVIGDGMTPGGVGGGGLGKVTIGSWAYSGFIRTTQSVGDFTVQNGDFRAVLEVDKFHLGESTQADIGHMTISNGAWGSSGSEIEGDVASFDAEAFLAGASLTAASMGKLNIQGDFQGTINLTDPDAPAIPTFTVNSNYVGVVISASPIKKLKINGDFHGSLQAPSIGSITAYSFIGITDGMGVPLTYIKTTDGSLGTITSTAGPVTDFSIDTQLVFKGIKVSLSKLTQDTIGIDNVHINALSIGNLSVSLKADRSATGLDLIGIRDSDFTTTAAGLTKATAGTIGNVSVTIAGAAGGTSATGIENSTFDSLVGTLTNPGSTINTLGNVSVKISGQNGAILGMKDAVFEANSVGNLTLNVSRGADPMSTAQSIDGTDIRTTGAIGAIKVSGNATGPQVDDLQAWAGTTIGAVSVKSTDLVNGTLANSNLFAGQALDLQMTNAVTKKQLTLASMGAVTVSGSITQTQLVAAGSIGAVTVGKDTTDSLILAGANLGGDFTLNGNESYQRAASIASLTVKGTLARTSVVAGINPGDNIFGNGDDTLANVVAELPENTGSIGAIVLGLGSGAASPPATGSHDYAIQAAAIKSLKVGTTAVTSFPSYLDLPTMGEDATDVLVRLIAI